MIKLAIDVPTHVRCTKHLAYIRLWPHVRTPCTIRYDITITTWWSWINLLATNTIYVGGTRKDGPWSADGVGRYTVDTDASVPESDQFGARRSRGAARDCVDGASRRIRLRVCHSFRGGHSAFSQYICLRWLFITFHECLRVRDYAVMYLRNWFGVQPYKAYAQSYRYRYALGLRLVAKSKCVIKRTFQVTKISE